MSEMSLQWTLVATFLYVEIGFMIILLLPFISPTRWQKIFRSRLVTGLTSYANLYFNVMLVALILLLLDAIREISRYKTRLNSSNDPSHGSLHYGPTMELVKEFRAQRNFYISGTSLFLWFVIKRLITLISNTAQLIAENKAIKQQAESANRTAAALLDSGAAGAAAVEGAKKERKKSTESSKSAVAQITASAPSENEKQTAELEKQLLHREEEIEKLKKNLEAMTRQAEGVSKEFDNLLKEHDKVCSKLKSLENAAENKKDD